MNRHLLLGILFSLLLAACSGPSRVLVGADRDAHGCIGSAGYIWSETQQKCIRPWEQAAQQKAGTQPQTN